LRLAATLPSWQTLSAALLKRAQSVGVEGQTINLGTGSEISIGELADKIIQVRLTAPLPLRVDPQRIQTSENLKFMRLLSNNQLAREILDWQPEVDLLMKASSGPIDWIEHHLRITA
jgi:nucleoside-diphosphate-sugar epimerase